MKIAIASDHRGYKVKQDIIDNLKNYYDIKDYGTYSEESCDYPLYAFKMCEDKTNWDLGILLCGTGIGVSIAANKVKNIRCARVVTMEDCKLSRQHNNANVIALSANKELSELLELINTFLNTDFSNEQRHIRRNEMVDNYEY